MAEETELGVGINAEVGGVKDAKELADAVGSIGDALRELVSVARNSARQLDGIERSASGVTTGVRSAKKEIDNLNNSIRNIPKNAPIVSVGLDRTNVPAKDDIRRNASSVGTLSTSATRASTQATAAAQALVAKLVREENEALAKGLELRKRAVEEARNLRLQQQAANKQETGTGAGSAAAVAGRFQASGLFEKQDAAAQEQYLQGLRQAGQEARNSVDQFFALRYALNDVSLTFGIAGASLAAFNVAVVKAAADYQEGFASIERTTGAVGPELENLKSQFVDLAQTIPTSFADLASIGTLAGQLNVPSDRIADFTKTVAQFTSATDVTVDAAATAFGRLDALLPDVQGNYNALGSSILQVGVNSVATESEIISTTSQIAAAGAQAGLSADQVIGLSASFASLGVAPEASRGTVVRVFGEMNKAIAEGGAALDEFADVAGMSSQEFAQSWGTKQFSDTFLSFLQGIGDEGSQAQLTLSDLGITATRDQNALLKLGQNAELVGENFGYAADGFSNGTALAEAFAITSETLNSKVKMLSNTLESLVAAIGESGVGPITAFVDALRGLAGFLEEIVKNPLAQWTAAAIGGMTAVAAVVLIAVAALSRLGATALAIRTVRTELTAFKLEAMAAAGGAQTFASRAAGAAVALSGMRAALISTGIGAALVILGTVAAAAADQIGELTKSSQQFAAERWGDATGLASALQADTDAAGELDSTMLTVSGTVTTTKEATAGWVGTLENVTGSQVTLNDSMINTTTSVESQTLAIGKNAQAWIASKVANDASVQQLVANRAKLEAGGFDVQAYISKLAQGDTQAAKQVLLQYIEDRRALLGDAGDSVTGIANIANDEEIKLANEALKALEGSLQSAANTAETFKVVSEATGLGAESLASGMTDMEDAADGASTATDSLSESVNNVFGTVNAIGDMSSSFYDLAAGIAESGNSFSAWDQAGQQNLANLQQAIESTITGGEALGISATESIGAMFQQLRALGVDTDTLIRQLSASPYKFTATFDWGGVQSIANGSQAMSSQAAYLANSFKQIGATATKASSGIGKVGKSAAAAAPKVRTLKDYANDLANVWKRASEIRFGPQNGLDQISSAWQDLAEDQQNARDAIVDAEQAINDINQSINETRISIAQLTADKAINEYFKGIADSYGDSLRGNALAADIADQNAQIADKTQQLSDKQGELTGANRDLVAAQDAASTSLEGNSAAAIRNRAALFALVGNYQDYMEALAASGASTATLNAESNRLRGEFIQQATQMGFNRAEVNRYSAAFDDMTTAINRVPRNITVAANTNPALQALNELEARASSLGGKEFEGPTITPTMNPARLTPVGPMLDPSDVGLTRNALALSNPQALILIGRQLYKQGYSEGGYTGGSSVGDVRGVVHGKEYVLNADATRRLGVPLLNALNNGTAASIPARAASSGGGSRGTGVMALSPDDRALLRYIGDRIGNIKVDFESAAGANSTGNFLARGSK